MFVLTVVVDYGHGLQNRASVDNIGAIGVVSAIPTEGVGALLVAAGEVVVFLGTIINIGIDVYNENYDLAIARAVIYGVTFGAGRAIESAVPKGSLDENFLTTNKTTYEKGLDKNRKEKTEKSQ